MPSSLPFLFRGAIYVHRIDPFRVMSSRKRKLSFNHDQYFSERESEKRKPIERTAVTKWTRRWVLLQLPLLLLSGSSSCKATGSSAVRITLASFQRDKRQKCSLRSWRRPLSSQSYLIWRNGEVHSSGRNTHIPICMNKRNSLNFASIWTGVLSFTRTGIPYYLIFFCSNYISALSLVAHSTYSCITRLLWFMYFVPTRAQKLFLFSSLLFFSFDLL